MFRFLSEDNHGDEHVDEHGYDHEISPEVDKKLQNIKIIVLFGMLIAGAFVFFPFISIFKEG